MFSKNNYKTKIADEYHRQVLVVKSYSDMLYAVIINVYTDILISYIKKGLNIYQSNAKALKGLML